MKRWRDAKTEAHPWRSGDHAAVGFCYFVLDLTRGGQFRLAEERNPCPGELAGPPTGSRGPREEVRGGAGGYRREPVGVPTIRASDCMDPILVMGDAHPRGDVPVAPLCLQKGGCMKSMPILGPEAH